MEPLALSLADANAYVAEHHRHSVPTRGHKFSVGAVHDGQLVGVAIVGRPTARLLDDGLTLEILRVCSTGERNACSFLYATCWRAMRAMGYRRCVTYTRAYEHGSSLKAAGFRPASRERPGPHGARKGVRYPVVPKEDSIRWDVATGEARPVTVSVTDARRCGGCGKALPRNIRANRKHCGNACRQRAHRRR